MNLLDITQGVLNDLGYREINLMECPLRCHNLAGQVGGLGLGRGLCELVEPFPQIQYQYCRTDIDILNINTPRKQNISIIGSSCALADCCPNTLEVVIETGGILHRERHHYADPKFNLEELVIELCS